MNGDLPSILVGAGLVFLLLWLVWKVVVGSRIFSIRVGRKGIWVHGEIPGHRLSEVTEFISSLGLSPGSRIWAVPHEAGFRLHFSPLVPEVARQRLRNFLYLPR